MTKDEKLDVNIDRFREILKVVKDRISPRDHKTAITIAIHLHALEENLYSNQAPA